MVMVFDKVHPMERKPVLKSSNTKPIGQVPIPINKQVHINSGVIGALPGATTSLRPVVKPAQQQPVVNTKRTVAGPAFIISPPKSINSVPVKVEKTQNNPSSSTPTNKEKGAAIIEAAPVHTIRSVAGEVWQDPTLADWDPNDFRIFVGDLGPEVTDIMLQQAFSPFGSLTKTRVIRDRKSNKSKGYGFVGFKEPQDFLTAMREMNGKYIGNRPVKLKQSNWTDRCADSAIVKKGRYNK